MTILRGGFDIRVTFAAETFAVLKQQPRKQMSNQHSVTKRHRRPKSDKRVDFTARTMAILKQLSQAAKVSESHRVLPKSV